MSKYKTGDIFYYEKSNTVYILLQEDSITQHIFSDQALWIVVRYSRKATNITKMYLGHNGDSFIDKLINYD